MAYNFFFTERAEKDLDEILNYIANELCNLTAAQKLGRQIFSTIDSICNFPDMGTLIHNELLQDKTVRFIPIENYTLYYKPTNETIYVLRIIYCRQNPDNITM